MGAVDDDEVFSSGGGGKMEKIFVSVRLRPLNEKEIAANESCDWECINDSTIIYRTNYPGRYMPPTAYTFDRVFQCDCSTKQVYEESAKEIALSVVSGINSTIFAYGQTSSGKTYTMSGVTDYTVADIYDYIRKHEERAFVLKFSAIEIYNEAVRDLLSTDSTPLRLLDDPDKGTIVEKLTEETLTDWNHLKALIAICEAQRKIGETSLNETSSRSHQILRLTIESSLHEFSGKDNSSKLVASVNFVDLAGSERASQSLSAGTRLKEGCHINRSLLTLGTVIRKLSKGRNGHIPYRDSKLTRILQPALGGNARTAIICTMCPAQSHIEQSRNTLLFASCAKEVDTNAQVNVVMSDKALVKQLQKQLARLENELRYPGIPPNFEMLLKEKDSQIRKMEKEIKELKSQRDLAQSQLQNLLNSVDDRASRHWDQSSQNGYEYAVSMTEQSDTIDHRSLNSVSSKFPRSYNQNHLQRNALDITSSNAIDSPAYENTREELEDICKEVRCIETDVVESNASSSILLTERNNSSTHGTVGSSNGEVTPQVPTTEITNPITLEQHLQCVRNPFNNFSRAYPDVSSPWPEHDSADSRSRVLTRSQSWRPTLSDSSHWFDVDQNEDTPPTETFKNFPGRPDGFKKRRFALKYDAEAETLSVEGSEYSKDTNSYSGGKQQDGDISEEQIIGIHDFVAGLKEMAQYQNQLIDPQNGEADGSTVKDVSLDLVSSHMQSPLWWPQEFEKKQKEIIELWHACNVSLVHRTYFFTLFKDDAQDSIYFEVELRRLSYLNKALTRESFDRLAIIGQSASVSSLKMLRREREMLCRQMQKRLSVAERESLFLKWGIELKSKQRKLRLARLVWSETNNLEHVRESASLVAKLIGLEEEGQTLKEMFGLSFTPRRNNRRLYSWRNGLSSLS